MTVGDILKQVSAKGKIFRVTFVKRTTGELRTMVCRLGVRKGVKGIGIAYKPADYALINVYDMQVHGFRMIDATTIKEIVGNGKRWLVTERQ